MRDLKNRIFRVFVAAIFPLAIATMLYWALCIKVPLPCVLYTKSGILCPTCGATRSIMALLEGDIKSSIGHNPMVTFSIVPVTVLALYLYGGIIFGYLGRISQKGKIIITVFVLGLAVLFFVFGIVRNIPLYPFTLLVPR